MWRTFKAAGRPWPVLDEDDYIDYQIMEAVAVKSSQEDQQQEEEVKKKDWKRDKSGLDRLRERAG